MKNQILYFIAGEVPTNEEFEQAQPLMNKGPFLEFISLATLDLNAPLIENKGVYGLVPEQYKVVEEESKPVAIAEKPAKVKEGK